MCAIFKLHMRKYETLPLSMNPSTYVHDVEFCAFRIIEEGLLVRFFVQWGVLQEYQRKEKQ